MPPKKITQITVTPRLIKSIRDRKMNCSYKVLVYQLVTEIQLSLNKIIEIIPINEEKSLDRLFEINGMLRIFTFSLIHPTAEE